MSFVTFFAVVILVLGGLHYYIWARLVRDTRLPQPWAAVLLAGLVVLAAGLPLMRLVIRRWPEAARILGWPFYTWLGVSMLLFFLLTGDRRRALARLGWKQAALPASTDRPRSAHAGRAQRRGRRDRGGRNADGCRAALRARTGRGEARAGDARALARNAGWIHASSSSPTCTSAPTIGRAFIEDDRRADQRARTRHRRHHRRSGRRLASRSCATRSRRSPSCAPRHGVYFVTGNHEYFSGADAWLAELTRLGIRVPAQRARLDRRRRRQLRPGRRRRPHRARASAARPRRGPGARSPARDPERELVLLAHQPRSVFEAARVRRRPAAVGAHARRPDLAVRLLRAPAAAVRRRAASARATRSST